MTHTSSERRPASWPVALVLPVLCLACVVGVLACAVVSWDRPVLWSFGGDAVGIGIGTGTVGLVIGTLSAVVLRHPGAHPAIGWALGGTGLFWAADGLAEAWVRLGLVSEDALPGMTFAVWFLMRFTALLTATIVLLPLLFPDGRFLPGPWCLASWVCMGLMVASGLAFTLVPYASRSVGSLDPPPGVDLDPTTLHGIGSVGQVLVGSLQLITVVGLVVPVGVVVHRYRRARGTSREQMRWLLWGALVAVTLVLLDVLLQPTGAASTTLFFVAVTVVPTAMTVAVVNPRLVPIDDLLGRTLVLAILAVVLVAVDFAVVALLSLALHDDMAQSQVVLVVLLTTVLLYGPLRQRLSRGVRRVVFGDRANPYDVVAGLASTLESADEGTEQLAVVAEAVASAFGVAYVRVEVDRPGGDALVATHGDPPDLTRSLPITWRSAEVGRLVLPARGVRSRLSRRDEELLGDLVRQAATAARTARLAEELQESRERLVSAREEERRRIRRDLHDGLGPALGGVVFELESARLLVASDPDAARSRLDAVRGHVQDVVADVRRLVHDLRPPALDDRGLVGALRQQGERLDPVVEVVTGVAYEGLGPLPAAVEVAAYRIASEAMANVARHAAASRCRVLLDAVDAALLVEVSDDGDGIPGDAEAGVGLVGMRERAAELGGRSEVVRDPRGGTVVRAWLPLRAGTHQEATP